MSQESFITHYSLTGTPHLYFPINGIMVQVSSLPVQRQKLSLEGQLHEHETWAVTQTYAQKDLVCVLIFCHSPSGAFNSVCARTMCCPFALALNSVSSVDDNPSFRIHGHPMATGGFTIIKVLRVCIVKICSCRRSCRCPNRVTS